MRSLYGEAARTSHSRRGGSLTRSGVAALLVVVGLAATAGAARLEAAPVALAQANQVAYRATAALSVTERFPRLSGALDGCPSTGFREVAWRAAIPRLVLFLRPRATLATLQPASGRFSRLESRVQSPCPGAFHNRFSGTSFSLRIVWPVGANRLSVITQTGPLDEGEGDQWTFLSCGGSRVERILELGGTPYYTSASVTLTAAEARALRGHRRVRIRRSFDQRFESEACGFGGDHFDVRASLDVQLTPLRSGATGAGGCTITGTPANDVLTGTAGRDVICGLAGNDVLRGNGGSDVLRGGAGNDVLFARDRVRDTVSGGAGRDRAVVDRDLDVLSGVETLG